MAVCFRRNALRGLVTVHSTGSTDQDLAELIRLCAAGQQTALRMLYEHLAPQLLGIALRLVGSRSLAEEALQDAFVQVWNHAGRYDASLGSPRTWIIGIVRYRALDLRRAEGRHVRATDLEVMDAEAAHLIDGVAPGFSESRAALTRCLQELNDGPRSSILLAYVDGCSHTEISERLGQPLGTVKSWVLRGLGSLKRCLER